MPPFQIPDELKDKWPFNPHAAPNFNAPREYPEAPPYLDVPPFDPYNAPQIKLTDKERAQIQAQMNSIVLKLRDAGLQFYGNFRMRDVQPFWGPTGFEFYCDDWKRLHDAASRASGLGYEPMDMPGNDLWPKYGVLSAGFTQKGKPPLVHLDIATNKPGLCRLYLLTHTQERKVDALRRAKVVTAKDTDVYKEIYRRVLSIGVDLDFHIKDHLTAGRLRLDGINFVANDHKKLIQALTDVTYPGGAKVFAPGSKMSRGHLPLSLSYLATDGIGFRQIWYVGTVTRPLQPPPASIDPKFSAQFGDSKNGPDLSALHCAVSPQICNIHIDEMGFVMADAQGKPIVDPDALRHILVELVWKTNLQGKLPFWALDRVNFDIVSSPLEYARAGVGFDVVQTKRVKATLRGTCAIDDPMDCAGTVTVSVDF